MSWVELSLNITHEAVDWVCTLLAATHYTDEIYVTQYTHLDTNLPINPDVIQPQWAFTIRLYLASDTYIEEIADSLLSLQRARLCSPLQEALVEKKPQLGGVNSIINRIGQRFVVLTPETPTRPHLTKLSCDSKPILPSAVVCIRQPFLICGSSNAT